MTYIFKVRRISLKGIESKTKQHFLSFDQAPPAVTKQMSSALASFMCAWKVTAAGLIAGAGYSPGWASPAEQPWAGQPWLPAPELPEPPGTTCAHLGTSGMSLGQGWLQWLPPEERLQEGPPQLGRSTGEVAPSLHMWRFPLTCWKLEGASSRVLWELACEQLRCTALVTHDRWNKEPLLLPAVSQTPFADPQEAPSSAEKHLYTVFQAQAFQGWIVSLLGTVLHSFSSLWNIDGVHCQTLCLLPLEEARESCN